ncbi:tigger transposable element-derived 4-like [Paramuricea clavata]|uniref:Tigger transposable element-derived 4-like n=1 Tax=Paramuricea clavata TaxID=317549 RepID=A0A6S7J532_PARCT|nr:tigger transposable element-derived 4-like [Paramuricea clavata]
MGMRQMIVLLLSLVCAETSQTISGTNKRKLSTKTLSTKYEALKKIERGIPKKDVAAEYNVPRNTLSAWLKTKKKLDEGLPVNGPILKEKAIKYAEELGIENFKASNGRFERWKGRHKISFKTVSGEAKSCTEEMTASSEESTLLTILSNYELRDIYNADEFGLFYKALPDKSLQLKSEKCVGGKHSKVRLTGLAAGNAVGQKLPMFVTGKSKKPRCFKGVRILSCRYRSQKKSWMDSALFEEWVREQDRKLLIWCSCHRIQHARRNGSRPMDEGVIRSIKAFYRGATVRKYIDGVEKGMLPPKFTILDAMMILTGAWNRVTAETVRNCFKKAGIGSEAQQSAVCDADDPFSFLSEELAGVFERKLPRARACVNLCNPI